MGSLPDVLVSETSMEDWQAVLDLVGASGWMCQYSEDETGQRLQALRPDSRLGAAQFRGVGECGVGVQCGNGRG